MHIIRFLSYKARRRAAPLLAATLMSACANGPPGTFTGSLTPLAGTCDATNRATLTRHHDTVLFTPQDGVLILEGTVAPGGAINASVQTTGMDRKPYRVLFSGTLTNDTITGTYVTTRCRYGVALHAVPGS
jgi:hypothetical protein